jgi:predicted PurR-regulated permease PerM
LIDIIIVIVIVYYLLKDGNKMKNWISNNLVEEKEYLKKVDSELESIYLGNMLTVIIIAVISIVLFLSYNTLVPNIINIPYPVFLSILTGLSSLIPIIGTKLIYIPMFLVLSFNAYINDLELVALPIIMIVIVGMLVDFIPETLIRPYLSNRTMNLGLVILSYLMGVMTFGWYGLFLGPLILAITYHYYTTVYTKN